MKIICEKSNLLKGVNIATKAVAVKTTMNILECVLIDATTDIIKLTCNDMELGIETRIEGSIVSKGMVAIDAKVFSEIIRKLPDSDVTIETRQEEESVISVITCEKSVFEITSRKGDDFSFLPYIEKTDSISISQFTLKDIIRQTIFSIAASDTNRPMTGELFEVNDDTLRVVSLDGHRISIRRIELSDHYAPRKVIVPGKTLNEISKILSGEADNHVEISFAANHILFEFDQTMVVSRLIEGEYFRIDQMLSGDFDTRIVINKREFMNCIDRATLLISESDKKPIILDITDENIRLSIKSQLGNMEEDIAISKEGKDLMIGFNPKFLLDALRVIDDDEITLYMINSKAPCFIKDERESYIYLILPVNFSGNR